MRKVARLHVRFKVLCAHFRTNFSAHSSAHNVQTGITQLQTSNHVSSIKTVTSYRYWNVSFFKYDFFLHFMKIVRIYLTISFFLDCCCNRFKCFFPLLYQMVPVQWLALSFDSKKVVSSIPTRTFLCDFCVPVPAWYSTHSPV